MKIIFQILILFRSFLIGKDQYKNKYYKNKYHSQKKLDNSYVMFNGKVALLKILTMWHNDWVYKIKRNLSLNIKKLYAWQKENLPNITEATFPVKSKRNFFENCLTKNNQQIAIKELLGNNYEI